MGASSTSSEVSACILSLGHSHALVECAGAVADSGLNGQDLLESSESEIDEVINQLTDDKLVRMVLKKRWGRHFSIESRDHENTTSNEANSSSEETLLGGRGKKPRLVNGTEALEDAIILPTFNFRVEHPSVNTRDDTYGKSSDVAEASTFHFRWIVTPPDQQLSLSSVDDDEIQPLIFANELRQQTSGQKQENIKLHLQVLDHSARCSLGCASRNCAAMKDFLRHYEICTIGNECLQCCRVRNLLILHAKTCHRDHCIVPSCQELQDYRL